MTTISKAQLLTLALALLNAGDDPRLPKALKASIDALFEHLFPEGIVSCAK